MSCAFLWYPAAPHILLGHYHEPQTELAPIWKDENMTRELEAALTAAKEAGEVLRKGSAGSTLSGTRVEWILSRRWTRKQSR
jgi:hypothetical protein